MGKLKIKRIRTQQKSVQPPAGRFSVEKERGEMKMKKEMIYSKPGPGEAGTGLPAGRWSVAISDVILDVEASIAGDCEDSLMIPQGF